MTAQELEIKARDIIESVKAGRSIEGNVFELKADWPTDNYPKTAKQLAGHANAALGENVIWIIGVAERNGTGPGFVHGASHVEPAEWLLKVARHLDGHPPEILRHVPFVVDGKSVVAMLFETAHRAPFVLQGNNSDYPQFTVPWRSGASTRAANRPNLLRLLVPTQRLPEAEVLKATFAIGECPKMGERPAMTEFQLRAAIYFAPQPGHQFAIPFCRCHVSVEVDGLAEPLDLEDVTLETTADFKPTLHICQKADFYLDHPGVGVLVAEGSAPVGAVKPESFGDWARVAIRIRPAHAGGGLLIDLELPRSAPYGDLPDLSGARLQAIWRVGWGFEDFVLRGR